VALPTFARHCCNDRSISPAQRAHGCTPAEGLLPWAHAGTDRETDGQTPYCFIDPAPHTMRAVPTNQSCPWVGLTHELGWVGLGRDFQFLVGWVGSTTAKVLKIRKDYFDAFKARLDKI